MPTGLMFPQGRPEVTGGPRLRCQITVPVDGVERVNVIGFCDGNNHRPTGTALDVERLRVNIAGNRAIKVEVTRQASGSGRRKGRVDVQPVAGKIVVLLDHIDLRVDSRNHTPHDADEK